MQNDTFEAFTTFQEKNPAAGRPKIRKRQMSLQLKPNQEYATAEEIISKRYAGWHIRELHNFSKKKSAAGK